LTFKPLAIGFAVFAASCGGGTPTSATTTAQVGGAWVLTETLSAVSGGDCVGALAQQAINLTQQAELQITQSGADVTAQYSDGDSTCSMTGTATSGAVTLNATSCSRADGLVQCPNGQSRTIRFSTFRMNATVLGPRLTGTSTDTWNVSTATGDALPPMALLVTFTANKR
jgi:hypothetical protein